MRFLKFSVCALTTSLLCLVSFQFANFAVFSRRPVLSASADSFLLKNVSPGTISDASITLSNNTTQAIRLSQVVASCGCTNVKASNANLAPGETSTVVASVKGTANMSVGVVGTVTIVTDADPGGMVIPVIVEKVEGINVVPPVLDLGRVKMHSQEPLKGQFFVVHRMEGESHDSPVTFTGSSDWIIVENVAYSPEKRETICSVMVDPKVLDAPGEVVGHIGIDVSNDKNVSIGSFTLPVRISVK